jgi:hypothetical protein
MNIFVNQVIIEFEKGSAYPVFLRPAGAGKQAIRNIPPLWRKDRHSMEGEYKMNVMGTLIAG